MKHYEYLCKYDPGTALPAIAFKRCDGCDAFLCPSCGYTQREKSGLVWSYCNECYSQARADQEKYPPQGEPGGEQEPLTKKEAIEAEQSSHVHP
jgi:RNase P subunit RPR2